MKPQEVIVLLKHILQAKFAISLQGDWEKSDKNSSRGRTSII